MPWNHREFLSEWYRSNGPPVFHTDYTSAGKSITPAVMTHVQALHLITSPPPFSLCRSVASLSEYLCPVQLVVWGLHLFCLCVPTGRAAAERVCVRVMLLAGNQTGLLTLQQRWGGKAKHMLSITRLLFYVKIPSPDSPTCAPSCALIFEAQGKAGGFCIGFHVIKGGDGSEGKV